MIQEVKNTEQSAKFGQFDNLAFKVNSERLFDDMFDYQRELKEKLVYSVTMDKGSIEEKQSLNLLEQVENSLNREDYYKYIQDISLDNIIDFKRLTELFSIESLSFFNFLSIPIQYEEQLNFKLEASIKKRLKRSR
ncbi:DUF5712 family protein [Myroides oncorhynchi]|uniref:DUF5712 family protein n=1 Tax=Myroides oncorhynchi TaxID=2893756 RepID=UPI00300CEEC8